MPELNTVGLPRWAEQLLKNNAAIVQNCNIAGVAYELQLTEDATPFSYNGRLAKAELWRTDTGPLCLVGLFGDLDRQYIERRWVEYSGGWQEQILSAALPMPEIQIDAGMPSGSMYFFGNNGIYQGGIKNLGVDPANGPDWSNISIQQESVAAPSQAVYRQQASQQATQNQLGGLYNTGLGNYGGGWLQGDQPGQQLRNVLGYPAPSQESSLGDAVQSLWWRRLEPKAQGSKPPDPPEPRSKNKRMIVFAKPEEE